MKKMVIGMIGMAAMLVAVPETMAGNGHHDRGGNDGLRLAAGIVHLVKEVIAPTPAVIAPVPAVVAPPPVVIPAPRPVIQPQQHRKHPHRPEPPRRNEPPRPATKGHRR